jgi:hypothetical protein
VPDPFVAVTVKTYAVPLVRPVTVQGEIAHVAVFPSGLDVAVKLAAGSPVAAGVKVTVAEVLPAVAVPIVGASGAVAAAAGLAPAIAATASTVPEAIRPPI